MTGFSRNFAIMLATAIVAAALFWLLRDHWGHALGALPYLLFLACPLMHLFMHHGHGGHQYHSGGDASPPSRTP
ncbi:hypothetical protein CA262_06315 [Sphingobium sp. GW456-12-10-14-TSB1]|jgi:hypothetical protein|uniref:DUF2933 domain-containing protein n=1 Tax=Novosphingobium soli TaxID=574956 RepID=A0ABV6CR63_9SPHN|nr:DUF2933 domain-containing protein [Sphingobium sp.]MBU0823227.1 DUF2933 domain-containing protein [Alphaproteobacteria bacterium]OUC54517.1 hypothetical protein CA262_06315 [Sphingobium sp. GW456-12-10-14-TSB1]MBS88222.1 DUF2933 domain-containing protein [Sphingobium sp.]MBU0869026.1 DUF2933 domain-containing protein [Alphaproteobacteria bacterium]MBU1824627.1 DUF2933 domain-containing protein [Alphaproteobacteria bacterium]